jgi:hypothetical protein
MGRLTWTNLEKRRQEEVVALATSFFSVSEKPQEEVKADVTKRKASAKSNKQHS